MSRRVKTSTRGLLPKKRAQPHLPSHRCRWLQGTPNGYHSPLPCKLVASVTALRIAPAIGLCSGDPFAEHAGKDHETGPALRSPWRAHCTHLLPHPTCFIKSFHPLPMESSLSRAPFHPTRKHPVASSAHPHIMSPSPPWTPIDIEPLSLNVAGIDLRVWGMDHLSGGEIAVMFFLHGREGSKEQVEREGTHLDPCSFPDFIIRSGQVHSPTYMEKEGVVPQFKRPAHGHVGSSVRH